MTRWYQFFRGAALVLAACFAAPESIAADQESPDEGGSRGLAWDFWVPRADLSARERARTPRFCTGAYRWPVFPLANAAADGELPVQAEARKAQY